LAAEAAAASEYRTCRKLIGLIASETFHDDMQELRDVISFNFFSIRCIKDIPGARMIPVLQASISAADARLCRSNLTRALQQAQHNILQVEIVHCPIKMY
jgi:hypothetical protein